MKSPKLYIYIYFKIIRKTAEKTEISLFSHVECIQIRFVNFYVGTEWLRQWTLDLGAPGSIL